MPKHQAAFSEASVGLDSDKQKAFVNLGFQFTCYTSCVPQFSCQPSIQSSTSAFLAALHESVASEMFHPISQIVLFVWTPRLICPNMVLLTFL